MQHTFRIGLGVAAVLCACGTALAEVTPEETKALGTTLTPWGATKAGNKEGTIPEWTGRPPVPKGYDPKNPGIGPDPFAHEKPLFTIDAKNMDKYADKLSEGQKEMLRKYPTYRLDVYPSHRTYAYPKKVQDLSIKNATSCKTSADFLTLSDCYGGVPFPIPKNGNQVMWNHAVKYTSLEGWSAKFKSFVINPTGAPILQGDNVIDYAFPWFRNDGNSTLPIGTDYYQYRQDTTAPARMAGQKLLIRHGTKKNSDFVWQYLPGQRRVKLSPDLAYDTPQPQSGGSSTMDDIWVFFGQQDRFDFKLIGKKEMYIPYNNYKLSGGAGGACSEAKLLTPNHFNPDCVRWELHRVWVVEGTKKPEFRHIYSKRTFYFDEDGPGHGLGDNYDASGKLYRSAITYFHPAFAVDDNMMEYAANNDFVTGVYNTYGLAGDLGGWYPTPVKPETYYTPDSLGASGIR